MLSAMSWYKAPSISSGVPQFGTTLYLILKSRYWSIRISCQTFSVGWVERNHFLLGLAPWLIGSTFQEYLSPKLLEIVERFLFYKRNKHEVEGISSYVTELTKLPTHILAGIWTKSYQINSSLDSEIFRSKSDYCQKPNYSKAGEIAEMMETAICNGSELQTELNSNPVFRVDKLT